MDHIYALNVKMDALKELIEIEKSALKMRQDEMPVLVEQLLATISTEWSPKYLALQTSHQDIKKTNSITIQKHTVMCIEYSALQDEYLALAKCTAGE